MFSYRYVAQHGGVKAHKFGLSAVMQAGEGRVKAAVAYMRGHDESVKTGDDTVDCWHVGAAYEYPLSKRTVLKPFVDYAKAGKAWSDRECRKCRQRPQCVAGLRRHAPFLLIPIDDGWCSA